MKLSAPPPPPPPPPPPEQPAPDGPPEGQPGGQPNETTPNAGTTPELPPPPEAAPAPPAPKILQWPGWYAGVDSTLAALVLVLAFAAGSFAARNSDVWVHLAAGKRLLTGQYVPGSDPFSYSATDHAWVNHSWLTDGVAYLLYGGQGKVLVIAKALVVALAFGILLALRRPKFSLWPWAGAACLAVMACAPYLVLRPQVVSMLFLAVTLYLLFAMPHKPDSWRVPIAIGVTFWFWANSDPWFFVGPLAVALIIVGELIQTKLLNVPEETPAPPAGNQEAPAGTAPPAPAEESLGNLPDLTTLAKALGIGVLACMLNPHHVGVWELPFEVTGADEAKTDPRLRQLVYSPLNSDFYNSPGLGSNLNGLSYVILFVAGAAILGFGYGRIRVAHLALWIGFALLSLTSIYAIPFFAIVAVPLVASQLNSLSTQVELKTWGDPKSRVFLLGSSIGRILCLVGACVLCVMAYPGWIHPDANSPASARRLAWGVEAEPSLQRAAEQFHQWRDTGALPADARGFIANVDLANYVAWFAPQEKVFLNGRFNHHRRELPDFVAVRKGFGLIGGMDDRGNPQDATDVLKKTNSEYVAFHTASTDSPLLRARAGEATSLRYNKWVEWSPWYLDGRTVVFGWTAPGSPEKPTFTALRVDPVSLAFGPNVPRLPEPELTLPQPPLGWEEPFVRPAKPAPLGAAEAFAWLQFKEGPLARQNRRQLIREGLLFPLFRLFPTSPALYWSSSAIVFAEESGRLRFPPTNPDATADAAALKACSILALQAARRGIVEDPHHPDSYFALAFVLQDVDLPLSEGERTLGVITAYRQCLVRMPPPERYRRGQYLANPVEVAAQLASGYLGRQLGRGFVGIQIEVAPLNDLLGQAVFQSGQDLIRRPIVEVRTGQVRGVPQNARLLSGNASYFLSLDVARETLKLALAYAAVDLSGDATEAYKKRVDQIEKQLKDVESAMIRANDQYGQAKGRKLRDMVEEARRLGLTEEALRLLSDKDTNLTKEYGEAEAGAVLLRISLELALGRIENTSVLLADLAVPEQITILDKLGLTPLVLMLTYQKAFHAGEYKTAAETWDKLGSQGLDVEPLLAAFAKDKVNPNEMLLAVFSEWPPPSPGGGLWPAFVSRLGLLEFSGRAIGAREQIADRLQNAASFHYRLGFLALLQGDVPTAKKQFLLTNRKPPPGWSLPDIAHTEARQYLRLIEMAEKKKPATP